MNKRRVKCFAAIDKTDGKFGAAGWSKDQLESLITGVQVNSPYKIVLATITYSLPKKRSPIKKEKEISHEPTEMSKL